MAWPRRRFLLGLTAILATTATYPAGERPPWRIMLILYRGMTEAEKGFMEYFSRRGIAAEFIVRDAHEDRRRIAEFVREARTLRPDLIYTFGTTVTAEVAGTIDTVDPTRHITDIPLVFNIVADPVGARLVPRLTSSGRNLTGASHLVPMDAQLRALHSVRPARRLGVIYNPAEANSILTIAQLKAAVGRETTLLLAPMTLDADEKPVMSELAAVMNRLLVQQPDFLYLPSDSFVIANARRIIEPARAAGVPVFSAAETPIRQAGALLGLVSRYYNLGEFVGYKAEQILLGGKRPADIEIDRLNRFSYLVNMEAAKQLKVYPPVSAFKFAEVVKF
ncbi:ABC transporter substrate-binding protein [Chitinimonas lacunae]|uniref:ABC transporter substrate-binding protein n=1 Tax=Chitinimonas lacunae TaxID=1963018 RepID=A0ABV8MLU0_9NEIS